MSHIGDSAISSPEILHADVIWNPDFPYSFGCLASFAIPGTPSASTTMTGYRILFFAFRKPGTTPAQFRTHYEENHMTKIKEMTGQHFPLSHVRRYIHRTSVASVSPDNGATERNANTPATILSGTQADFDYDAIVEMTFEDEEAFQAFYGILKEPENAKWIADDEETFLDRTKLPPVVVLGDITSQER